MAHPRMRQLHKQLAGPRRRRVERGDRGADATRVVVGAGLVLLRDGDFGGGHFCVCGGGGGGVKGGYQGGWEGLMINLFSYVECRGWEALEVFEGDALNSRQGRK